jgi:hypothetical protein
VTDTERFTDFFLPRSKTRAGKQYSTESNNISTATPKDLSAFRHGKRLQAGKRGNGSGWPVNAFSHAHP